MVFIELSVGLLVVAVVLAALHLRNLGAVAVPGDTLKDGLMSPRVRRLRLLSVRVGKVERLGTSVYLVD
ncbi:hypothetical protein WP4W18E05_36790 [Klebsiella sp. WP4-W18-ESBL-05]|nr:hypothetical protein [Klebsiella sp. WP4-W18-ESBL-05]BBR60311.1 hypothetical protein WP4W18E05_36790 [Klebsiella sp. WP4-W18-ESBL-05]